MSDPQRSDAAGRGFLMGYAVVFVLSLGTAAVFAATGEFTTQQLAIVFTIVSVLAIVLVVLGARTVGRARRADPGPDSHERLDD
jgi:membrane protein implicated in regulation of membrane protease activity